MQRSFEDITICSSIGNSSWLQPVALARPEFGTGSFPCKSWSSASWQQGLNAENGLVFIEGMMIARITRPRYLLLENVIGLVHHPHFPTIKMVIHHAGYRLVHSEQINASDRLPVKRARWIAILQRYEDTPAEHTWNTWQGGNNSNAMNWDVLVPTERSRLTSLEIPLDTQNMYYDAEYLPKGLTTEERADPKSYRLPRLTKKLPTFLSMYTRQHELPENLLKERGLLGHFIKEHDTIRWIKVTEEAYMHNLTDALVLPHPTAAIYQHLGNCIVPHHAVLALANMYQMMNLDDNTWNVQELILKLEETRLRASKSNIVFDDLAVYMGTREQCEARHKAFQLLMSVFQWHGEYNPTIPDDSYFHPQKGKCLWHTMAPDPHMQIPRTVPFTDEQIATSHAQAAICEHDENTQVVFPTLMGVDDADDEHSASEQECAMTEIDETMQCNPSNFVTITVQHATREETFLVHKHMEWGTLLDLWNHEFLPGTGPTNEIGQTSDTVFQHDPVHSATLVREEASNCILMHSVYASDIIIMVKTDNSTYMYPAAMGSTWDEVNARYPELASFATDVFGQYSPKEKHTHSTMLHAPLPVEKIVFVEDIQTAIRHVQMLSWKEHDSLMVELNGSTDHLAAVATLWRIALNRDWQKLHGRTISFEPLTSTKAQLHFKPMPGYTATPISIFRTAVCCRLFQTAMQMHSHDSPAAFLRFKYGTRHILILPAHEELPFGQVYAIVEHTLQLLYPGQKEYMRMITCGKLISHQLQLRDLPRKDYQTTAEIAVHFVYKLSGGGPADGNRHEHAQSIRASCATMLLQHGLSLDKVPLAVQTLIKKYGLPQIQDLVHNKQPAKATEEQFRHMCDENDIALPMSNMKQQHSKLAHQTAARSAKANKNVDINNYQLQQGFFLLADKSPCPLHSNFSPHKPGVTMLSPAQAEKWQQATSLSPDEAAIFVVGEPGPLAKHPKATQIIAPALNSSGNRVLLGGILIQLGEKDVLTIGTAAEDEKLEIRETQVCSITLWQTDFSPTEWKKCCEAPVKFSKQLLDEDNMGHVIKNPFGRAYRNGTQPCPPNDATSIQYHSEIWIKDLKQVLRRSGYNRVFITPKDATGRPSTYWKPIWVDAPRSSLEARTATQPGMAGFIRGNRITGVRVETSCYADCWKLLKPDAPLPRLHSASRRFKIQPFPFGMDVDIIQEWLDRNQWDAQPVKPAGAKAWIIATDADPPQGILHFNNQPLLIKEIQERGRGQQVGLIAGPPSRPNAQSSKEEGPTNVFRQGDPFLDPWTRPSPAASTAGPSTKRFDHQEQRLDALEQNLRTMQTQVQQANTEQQTRITNLEGVVHQQAVQTQAAFQTMQTDFDNTLRQALATQENRLATSMAEIKQLLLRRDKRKSTSESDEDLG
eukprot:Skav236665  [mRNA]  locus=scaffold338:169296:173474:+ [translate_table: standard]